MYIEESALDITRPFTDGEVDAAQIKGHAVVTAGAITHRVQPGDTLWKIAKQYYGLGAYYPLIGDAVQYTLNIDDQITIPLKKVLAQQIRSKPEESTQGVPEIALYEATPRRSEGDLKYMVYYPYEPGMTKAKVAQKTNDLSYAEKKITVTEKDVHFQDGRAYVTNVETGENMIEWGLQEILIAIFYGVVGGEKAYRAIESGNLGNAYGDLIYLDASVIYKHGMHRNGEDYKIHKSHPLYQRILSNPGFLRIEKNVQECIKIGIDSENCKKGFRFINDSGLRWSLAKTSWTLIEEKGEIQIQVWDNFNFESSFLSLKEYFEVKSAEQKGWDKNHGIPSHREKKAEFATMLARWANFTNFKIILDPVPLGEVFPSFRK